MKIQSKSIASILILLYLLCSSESRSSVWECNSFCFSIFDLDLFKSPCLWVWLWWWWLWSILSSYLIKSDEISEVWLAKIHSSLSPGHSISFAYFIKGDLYVQVEKYLMIISVLILIILGRDLSIILERNIFSKFPRMSIINSNDFGLCYFRAISRAVSPFSSGWSRTRGMLTSWLFKDFSSWAQKNLWWIISMTSEFAEK